MRVKDLIEKLQEYDGNELVEFDNNGKRLDVDVVERKRDYGDYREDDPRYTVVLSDAWNH